LNLLHADAQLMSQSNQGAELTIGLFDDCQTELFTVNGFRLMHDRYSSIADLIQYSSSAFFALKISGIPWPDQTFFKLPFKAVKRHYPSRL
jgi:hypothetical protein